MVYIVQKSAWDFNGRPQPARHFDFIEEEEAKLSDRWQLIVGITLLIVSVGVFVACLPRKGKAIWLVRRPFFAPTLTVLVIGGVAIGLVELIAYFTTVDDITLSGAVRR